MKCLLIVVLLVMCDHLYSGCRHVKDSFHCVTFVSNYDGDTLTVDIPRVSKLIGSKISIRIRGIDTPEIRSDNECEKRVALKAKLFVYNILKNAKRIDLINTGRDKYFRIDADVIVDKVNLKDLLIKEKFAYLYDGGTRSVIDWCNY